MVVQHKSTVYSIPLVTLSPSRDTAASQAVSHYARTASSAVYGRPREWELRSNDRTFNHNKVQYAEVTVWDTMLNVYILEVNIVVESDS